MTTPYGGNDPGQWPDPDGQPPDGQPPYGGPPQQGPGTGGSPAQGPGSGGYPAQNPGTGGYPAQPPDGQPPYGGPPRQGPGTGGPGRGGYPPQQPGTGGFGVPPATSGQPIPGGYGPPPYGPGGPQGPSYNQPPKKKSNKGLWIGLGAFMIVGALVASYFVFIKFGGINNNKGEIANAKAFLAATEKTWKGGLPNDGINLSKKAGCFYVLDKDDEVNGTIACGPARRSDTNSGNVWDLYPYKTSSAGDKQEASDLGEAKVSQSKPSGTLVTVKGDEPSDDGADLKEPPLPKAQSKGVWNENVELNDDGKGGSVKLSDKSTIIFPGVQMTVKSITEYKSAKIDGRLSQPAKDEKFYAVTMTQEAGPIGGSTTPALGFSLDGKSVTSDVVLSGYDPELTVLVSAPKKGKSSLVLDADGHKQSINLSNGERAADGSTDIFYQPPSTATFGTEVSYPTIPVSAGIDSSLFITIKDATLTGYDEYEGWPGAGKNWMTINVGQLVTLYSSGANSGYTSYSVDCVGSTIDGGVTAKSCEPIGGGTYAMVFEVPAGTKKFTVTFNAVINAGGAGLPDIAFNFGGQSTTITLP